MPFPTRNQLPVAAIFLELTGLPPCTTPQGRLEVQAWSHFSNTLQDKTKDGYALVIDHERVDTHAVLHYGLSAASDISLDAGYVRDARSGLADNLIRNFHEFAGLPQGGRADRPENLYEYTQVNGRTGREIRLTEPPAGFAEPVLTYRRQEESFPAWWGEEVLWGWRLAAKLPLGDDSPAIASRKPDVGAGMMFDSRVAAPWLRVDMFGDIGLAYLAPSDATAFPTRRWVPMGTGGFAISPLDRLTVLLQWQVAGPRYRNVPIDLLTRPQNIALLGVRYRMGEGSFSLAVSEDPNTTGEDIGLWFSYTSGAF